MSNQQNKVNNRAKEYVAILKTKSTQDLNSLRESLLSKFKAEHSKSSPNNKILSDYNIQLSLLGRELKGRAPIHERGDNFQAVEDATVNEVKTKTFEEKLKEKTLDELNSMVVNGKKKLEKLNAMKSDPNISADKMKIIEDKLNHFGEKLAAIESEIATRSKTDADQAKSDASSGSKLFSSIDKDYIVPALIGGLAVGAIGYSVGRSVIGFGILGAGIGAGIVWINKNSKTSKVANV